MKLKSYSSFKKKPKKNKKKPLKDIVTGGVTALIGVGLLSETSRVINRI